MNVAERLPPSPAATRFLLRCLGRFRLEDRSGNQFQLRTRKARALLAYLALSGRSVPREFLADLLWSDRGPVQARSSLRQAVFELQHLECGDESILAVSRDDLALRPDLAVTDIDLIHTAASDDEWPRLQALLQDGEPGLLSDLGGLDTEFDDWLRIERAQQPARTLAAAINAAERCLGEEGPRAAQDIVSEVLRLDPANEEATRLALTIDHQLGDNVALHRRYATLRERLRQDYDAEPSAQTAGLFQRLTKSRPEARGPEPESRDAARDAFEPPENVRLGGSRVPILAGLAVLAIVAAAAIALLLWRDSTVQTAETAPVLLAVLPFEQQAGNDFLAEGLWEHTRGALTRNSALRVLGRATTAAMAERRHPPKEYFKRFGVTHLLEGSVRRNGSQVMVSVSLSRTSDGLSIWHEMFRGRMGEPFGLQDAIANGIEGKLRGRLARGGGHRAEQIATSPEVYGLYSEARELLASRQRQNLRRAEALLRQAVRTDSNYAPAWSLLGAAIYFNGSNAIVDSRAQSESLAAVRRALALAPNLAQAHATLAILEGENSPNSERLLRRAVTLDPSYAEAWNWLGNSLNSQFRFAEAMAAYEHALILDPLQMAAAQNLANTAGLVGNHGATDRLLQRIARAGASKELIGSLRANQLYRRRDYSGAVQVLLDVGLDAQGHPPRALWFNWLQLLTALGHYETLHGVTECPEWYAPLLRGKVMPPKTFEGRTVAPAEFWTSLFFSGPASRTMVNMGHGDQLVQVYRAAFQDADLFISRTIRLSFLADLAPTLAVALNSEGARDEARYILAAASRQLEPALRRPGNQWASSRLALVRAAQGERAQSLALLEFAIRHGWMPDGRSQAIDLAEEPALRGLRGNPKFEALRQRVLSHIARERAELGPIEI